MNPKKIAIMAIGLLLTLSALAPIALLTQTPEKQEITCKIPNQKEQQCYNEYGLKDYLLLSECAYQACELQFDEPHDTQCAIEPTIVCQKKGKIPIPDTNNCTKFKQNKQKIINCIEETK
jgi:hypothetical protein